MEMKVSNTLWQVVVASVLYACTHPSLAVGWPPGYDTNKPLPAYESRPNECYVLLRPQGGHVFSSKAPVCMAVLENFNQFCDEPAQYDRRKIHPGTRLSEPDWVQLDPMSNFDLVKQTFLSTYPVPTRDANWQLEEPRLRTLAQEGVLQLHRADLQGLVKDLRGGVQAVYRLLNTSDSSGEGQNQPRLMFVPGDSTPPELLRILNTDSVADLWIFDNDLFLVRYEHALEPVHRLFVVSELARSPRAPNTPIVAAQSCVLQFKEDRKGGK